ncbi:MAG: flagellar hook-associated protein FlgL [Labedaea sp.]
MIGSYRVTEQSRAASLQSGLRANQNRLEQLRERVTTGKQVTKPSDSPTGAAAAMRIRADLATRDRYMRSAGDGVGRLDTAEGALNSASNLLNRARDLLVEGMSSPAADSPTSREAIAAEVESLRNALLSVANTRYLGRPVFGGTTAGSAAFDPSGAYVGDSGQVQRRIADSVQVRVDVPATAFGTGSNQLFTVLDSIANNLRTNPSAAAGDLDRLDSGMASVHGELAAVGTRYSQLTAASDAADAASMRLTTQLSSIEDVDLARAVIDLQTQNVGYEAALAAAARVIQPSLLDYLR